MIVLDFNIPPDLHLSANHRTHWGSRSRATKTLRALGYYKLIAIKPMPQLEQAKLTVTIAWPNRRRRDAANLAPTVKALVDGIVSGPDPKHIPFRGLLPDDDDRHLMGPDLRVADELCPSIWACQLSFQFERFGDDHAISA